MKMKIKRKPPGRPWHKPATSSKVCLLCLRRYQESLISSESSDEEEDDHNHHHHGSSSPANLLRDPLADDDDDVLPSQSRGDPLPLLVDKADEIDKVIIPKKPKPNLYVRFLKFLSRYLQIKTKRFRHAATKNELSPPFCEQCRNTVRRLCDMYEELNKVKLNLQWRLMQIGDTVKGSKLKVSGKMGISLVKSLSTQLHVSSSNVVDILRKQVSLKSSLKSACRTPKVSINRNSCLNAMSHKLKYPMDQIKQYMVSLIVIFALALPPKKVEKKKILPLAVDKHRSIIKKNGSPVKIKRDIKVEAKKENVPPNVKVEPVGGKGGETNGAEDDGGGEYSPPNSGPNSPANNSDDEDGNKGKNNDDDEEEQKNSDSDWSMKGIDSGSDAEFSVRPETERRWNLRKRRTRASAAKNNDDDNYEDFTPGVLPPLRAPKGSSTRPRYDDSEKNFSCNLCSKRFRLERTLKRHLSYAHSLFLHHKCPKCNLQFRKLLDLKIHKKKAHRPANFKMGDQLPYKGVPTPCTFCQKVFPSRIKMMKHRKCHKLMEKHTCEVCGKVVVGEFRIRFHMKTHNRPDKPHHCDQCPRSFVTQEGLDIHKKLHDGNPDWVPWSRKKQKKSDRPQRSEGPHKCEEPNCGKSFFKPYNLQVHMALHATSFSCSVCEKTFNRVRELRRHLNKLHETENNTYFCIHCDKGYTMKQSFDIHKTVAHPSKGKVPCDEDYCTEEFDDADLLREHLKTHLEGDNQEAQTAKTDITVASADNHDATTPAENIDLASTSTEVKQQTTEETAIEDQLSKDELEAMKPGIHTCDRCNWSFSKKLSLTLHKLVHTPRNEKNMYPCVLCEDKAFAVVDSLQTHYNRLHGPKIKPYLCLKCGIRFHRKESFIPHMKMHDDRASNATFECTTCKKKFRDSLGLEKHMRTHDSANSRKCKECDETFTSKLSLMYHNHAKHGMERPFKCDVDGCGKGFFNQHQLTDHKICHTEGKYQCTLCPKKFRRHHNLTDHILVHKQEKNHICDFCGKAFVKKSSLNLHLAIHSGEKNYKCPHCPKAFCRKYARDCHIRVHTKETPFSCKICGRKFGQYTSMRNHLKVHLKLNSSVILRRPFKKTLAAGTPLVEKLEIAESSNATATEGTDNNVIPKHEEVPTASGIIHEALQAAFQDINMDLETAVKEDEDVAEQENDKGADEESEPEPEVPVVKRRRGRPKKSKDFICGICGKAFVREKPYAAHVERHLNEDGQNDTSVSYTTTNPSQQEVSHVNLSMPELIPSSAVMPPVSQPDIHPLTLSRQTFLTNPPPAPQVIVPPTRKSARRVSNKAPGSRLAQIVEDVIEAATNKGASNVVATSSATTTNIIQNHFHQESIPQHHNHHHHHNMPQNHHIQSPPPHHLSQPNSERSTPTGSIHSPSPIPTTTSTPSTTTAFPSSSFLSPFLYANPYLLPRQPQQGEQQLTSDSSVQFQGQTFSGFPNVAQNNRQQPQQQQQFQYQHNQMQYQHNVQQQHPSHRSPNTMPQDLSKSSYNLLFFGNSR